MRIPILFRIPSACALACRGPQSRPSVSRPQHRSPHEQLPSPPAALAPAAALRDGVASGSARRRSRWRWEPGPCRRPSRSRRPSTTRSRRRRSTASARGYSSPTTCSKAPTSPPRAASAATRRSEPAADRRRAGDCGSPATVTSASNCRPNRAIRRSSTTGTRSRCTTRPPTASTATRRRGHPARLR